MDTIQVTLPNLVTVQVFDSGGRSARNIPVTFNAARLRGPQEKKIVLVCDASATSCPAPGQPGDIVRTQSDSEGRAQVRIGMGTVAMTGHVRVTAPTLGLVDSLAFTVQPGAPAGVRAGVRDSTAYVGNSYSIRAHTIDRFGNETPAVVPLQFSAGGAAAKTTMAGVFQALEIGRAFTVIRSGSFTDTAWITVPPRGMLASLRGPYGATSVVSVELDGSVPRLLHHLPYTAYYGTWPTWRSQTEVMFEAGGISSERIMIVDSAGVLRRLTPETTATSGEIFSARMPDGSVLFSAWGLGYYGTSIWRATAPGQIPERLGPNPHGDANNWKASAAPDGKQIVYVSVDRGLSIMNVGGGSTRRLQGAGNMPRWSPAGDWIVFNEDNTLYLIRPDGTDKHVLIAGQSFGPGANWSPDGQWIIADAPGGAPLVVINVATRVRLPLGWSGDYSAPAWR